MNTATRHTASIATPDGATMTYNRHGDTAQFVVYGRDAVAVRKEEQPTVAQWCGSHTGARLSLADWRKYGGEWAILPVTYAAREIAR